MIKTISVRDIINNKNNKNLLLTKSRSSKHNSKLIHRPTSTIKFCSKREYYSHTQQELS